jgi:HD superfamily phosphohydrolase
MIACLYHDVATPPFAHTVEDVFREKFSFNHEQRLYDLLTGKTDDLGRERAQVFQGRGLKLQSVLQRKEYRELDLDAYEIASFAIGRSTLGSLVNGSVDLDNIDNVVRASSALSIRGANSRLAVFLAKSFTYSNGRIVFSEETTENLETWRKIRYRLYSLIYKDAQDFALETMIKQAVRILTECRLEEGELREEDWHLTEEELVQTKLMKNPTTREIAVRIRNADSYACLALFSVKGTGLHDSLISEIEQISRKFFGVKEVLVNYHFDKRIRSKDVLRLQQPLTRFVTTPNQKELMEEESPNIIVGIFTPERLSSIERKLRKSDFEEAILPVFSNCKLHFSPSGNKERA